MAQKSDLEAIGEWSENADRLVPRGEVMWINGPLGCAGAINGKPVASARKAGRSWMLRITGWQWHVNADMGLAVAAALPASRSAKVCKKGISRASLFSPGNPVLVSQKTDRGACQATHNEGGGCVG